MRTATGRPHFSFLAQISRALAPPLSDLGPGLSAARGAMSILATPAKGLLFVHLDAIGRTFASAGVFDRRGSGTKGNGGERDAREMKGRGGELSPG